MARAGPSTTSATAGSTCSSSRGRTRARLACAIRARCLLDAPSHGARRPIHFDIELAAPELLMRALGGDVERCQRRGQRRILRAGERAMITTYLDKALR